MGAILGALVDFVHALLMVAWVLGLPLLFWHRWPRVTRAYAIYAVAFVVVSQTSHALIGECFLTTIARLCWEAAGPVRDGAPLPDEWFTVRLAEAVFRLTPSHRAIKIASEILIVATAVGVVIWLRGKKRATPKEPAPGDDASRRRAPA